MTFCGGSRGQRVRPDLRGSFCGGGDISLVSWIAAIAVGGWLVPYGSKPIAALVCWFVSAPGAIVLVRRGVVPVPAVLAAALLSLVSLGLLGVPVVSRSPRELARRASSIPHRCQEPMGFWVGAAVWGLFRERRSRPGGAQAQRHS